jgi:hypothetical protein
MKKVICLVLVLTLACVSWWEHLRSAEKGQRDAMPTTTNAQTQDIVTAKTTFLNSLSADQREKVQFPFTPEKTATAAKFARHGMGGGQGPGGGPGHGGPGGGSGAMPEPSLGQHPNDGGLPKGGPGGIPGKGLGGFVGEQYGKAIWSNFPVSDVPRPGLQLGSLNSAQRAVDVAIRRASSRP